MPPRRFTDRDGVEWLVTWRRPETIALVVGGEEESYAAGLLFECPALVFRAQLPLGAAWLDPRAFSGARLQAMIDREMER